MNPNPYCRLESVTLDISLPNNRFSLPSSAVSGSSSLVRARSRRRSKNVHVLRALDNVNLRLEAGDRVALIGPNGGGKTSLLRVIAGIYEPTQGRITRCGCVSSLQPTLPGAQKRSGYESIVAQGRALGLRHREIEDRIDEIATFSELGNRLEMPVKTYSQGMLTRLAFAVNACFEFDILLIDEWIDNLDWGFMSKVEKRIRERSERLGILVVASRHPDRLRRLCLTGAVLEAGRLKAVERIEDAIRRA